MVLVKGKLAKCSVNFLLSDFILLPIPHTILKINNKRNGVSFVQRWNERNYERNCESLTSLFYFLSFCFFILHSSRLCIREISLSLKWIMLHNRCDLICTTYVVCAYMNDYLRHLVKLLFFGTLHSNYFNELSFLERICVRFVMQYVGEYE